jgi:uncharacterized protein YjbI with pentapeptide repeats
MTIQIKNKTGAILFEIDAETLCGANLSGADLYRANLREADLHGANLSGADLLLFCKMDAKVFKEITEGWFEWEISE